LASILTNTSAMLGLQVLNATNADLATSQRRLATGLKVSSPIDDGATFAIAQVMRAKIGSWQTVTQSLARGKSALDVATAATQSINDLLSEIKAKTLAYQDASLDKDSKAALQANITGLIDQVDKQANAATFDGVNFLTNPGKLGVVGREANSIYSLPASNLTPQSFFTPMSSGSTETSVWRSMVTRTAYTVPYSPLTPDAFSQVMRSVANGTGVGQDRMVLSGAGSVQFDLSEPGPPAGPGNPPGQISVALDAFTDPNAVEIWMNGKRVAATGQPAASGGADPGAATPVSGQNVLTFDYDGSTPPVVQVVSNTNSPWAINGAALSPRNPPASSPGSITTTVTSVPTSDPLPATPLSLETSGAAPTNGQATYTLDGGATPGRVDMVFDASLTPDTVDIYQNGARVAATGQAYAPGGGAVAAGTPVAGQSVLSFDYDPSNGPITFKFNENNPTPDAGWVVGGLVLQPSSAPPPNVPFTTTTTQTVDVNVTQQSLDDLTNAPPLTPETENTQDGVASYAIDGGANPGRVDMLFDGYADPDTVTIYQNGAPVAASGQPYAPGGGPVAAATPVAGQQLLSFDYDPANGRDLTIEVNAGQTTSTNAWTVGAMVLQDPSAPLPTGGATTFTYAEPGIVYPHYDLVRSPDGSATKVSSRDLTASGLGLAGLDWTKPATILQAVTAAMATAQSAGAYFGAETSMLDHLLAQDGKLIDTLTSGLGNLVDADMGKEAAKYQAAQVRQQLATKSLAISNASPNWVLTLFGGQG
jgi:flagellin-like hook-associated protein FlgL